MGQDDKTAAQQALAAWQAVSVAGGASRLWPNDSEALLFPAIMQLLSLCAILGLASAFTPPATLQPVSRLAVSTSGAVMGAKKPSPTKPTVSPKAKPLSPGSNYPATKNIQTQSSGFGTFVQKFQLASGKSKYGVPVFLPNGNVNPAYLKAEREEMLKAKKQNMSSAEKKRKGLIAAKSFELADYIRKKIGEVGSGPDYYKSGR
ncbi:hypothetical protein AB1Y20_022173 [Prymnesium parvum]|uniref:Uncharacterized protein n=1 Tax=Prymnesium parvum TaxID=97485 RepID=A0AB34JIK0_PRYPA